MRNVSFFILLTFFFVSSISGQVSVDKWVNAEAVAPRTRVVVESKDGSIFNGKVVSVTSNAIALTRDGRLSTFARDNIESIHLGRRGSVLKRAFLGAGAGALIGFGAGAAATMITGEGRGLLAAQGLLYGIPAGAVIGAATGGRIKRGQLIYRAP